MTGAELTMMVICYPDIEIKAFDPVTGEYQPVASIEFNAAAEAVELQTFKPIKLKEKIMVFVFGSNEKGIHGGGAAKFAVLKHGAIYGQGVGRQGNSYALPTCLRPVHDGADCLSYDEIQKYVDEFIQYAKDNPTEEFQVTQVGCGLAGLNPADIAPMFAAAPDNCQFDTAWAEWLPGKRFWGTF